MQIRKVRFVSHEGDIRRTEVEVEDTATDDEVMSKALDEDRGLEIFKIIDVD